VIPAFRYAVDDQPVLIDRRGHYRRPRAGRDPGRGSVRRDPCRIGQPWRRRYRL